MGTIHASPWGPCVSYKIDVLAFWAICFWIRVYFIIIIYYNPSYWQECIFFDDSFSLISYFLKHQNEHLKLMNIKMYHHVVSSFLLNFHFTSWSMYGNIEFKSVVKHLCRHWSSPLIGYEMLCFQRMIQSWPFLSYYSLLNIDLCKFYTVIIWNRNAFP